MNPALILKFKSDFDLDLSEIDINDEELTPLDVFDKVKQTIKNQKNWILSENIYLAILNFENLVIFKDLKVNEDIICRNLLLQTLCGKNELHEGTADEIAPIENYDEDVAPWDIFQIDKADSSQQQAIEVAKKNHNLIIEGPPGTGKSQTITNIIAELLAQNKKILFVSQKQAALEVVQNKLKQADLADFCLSLHKNANKKEVISELARCLDEKCKKNIVDNKDLEKLQECKQQLNDYVKESITPCGKLGETPFDAIKFVSQNSEIEDLGYVFKNIADWDKEKLLQTKKTLEKYVNSIKILGCNPKYFSWYGCEVNQLEGYSVRNSLEKNITNFVEKNIDLEKDLVDLSKELFIAKPSNVLDINRLIEITNIIVNIPTSAFKTLAINSEKTISDMKYICDCITQFNHFNNMVKDCYNLGILSEDIDELIDKFSNYEQNFSARLSIFNYIKDCLLYRKYKKNNYNPDLRAVVYDLKNLKTLKQWIEKIDNCNELAKNIFDTNWLKEKTCENTLNEQSKTITKFYEFYNNGLFNGDILNKFNIEGINYNKINKLKNTIEKNFAEINDNFSKIKEITKLSCNKAFDVGDENVLLQDLSKKFSYMLQDINGLSNWFNYINISDEIKGTEIADFCKFCHERNINEDLIVKAFETQFYRLWLFEVVFPQKPMLNNFSRELQEHTITEFKKYDLEQIEIAKVRLRYMLSQKTNTDENYNSDAKFSEVGILRQEARKQRKQYALRKLFKNIPNLLLKLKPCIMMSPVNVSKLLSGNNIYFDAVIFDEASQLPTEECVAAISRAKNMIVAGDSKQLPPSSFFKRDAEYDIESDEELDEDSIQMEDMDSLLDQCTTANFPQCPLKWHYRSRHEHLIAFSNKHLYGNKLYTFPSPDNDSDEMGVHLIEVKTSAESIKDKRIEEAKQIAKAIIHHAKYHRDKSLGVVAFNINQANRISDMLEELKNENQEVINFFDTKRREPFFIKSIENVQGDERDYIFISMGKYRENNKPLNMNFGPINQEGGERRLNVLVTRAKESIKIFSAIKAYDFDMEKTNRIGVRLLRDYLDFAERKEQAIFSAITEDNQAEFDSPFEESVYNVLNSKNIHVVKQVGCADYKIDLAIVDKDKPGKYILGIECDGASYHSSKTARDRDWLRQKCLENLGWTIYRIWSTDWFKNRQHEIEKLLNAVKNAENEINIIEESKKKLQNEKLMKDKIKQYVENTCTIEQTNNSTIQEYELCNSVGFGYLSADELVNIPSISTCQKLIIPILKIEAPIHKMDCYNRAIQVLGIQRLGTRIVDYLNYVIRYGVSTKLINKKGNFLYLPDKEITMRNRKNIIKIDIEKIPPEEIKEFAIYVIKNEFGIEEEALINRIAKTIGFNRVTDNIYKSIKKDLKVLKNDNKIKIENKKFIFV